MLGKTNDGTVFGQSLIFFGHLSLIFAFIGLFEAQGKRNGLFGNLGMLFGLIGTTFVTAVVYVEIAAVSGVNVNSILNEGVSGIIYTVGPLFFVFGMILVGISIMKEGILPFISGLCLIIGTFVFTLATFIPNAEGIISVIGGTVTGIGFVWIGKYLLSPIEETKQSNKNESFISLKK
ncbi:hypothetical protein ABET41_09675 [Metabacillus fastidiosus]|uniref:hypothetical protein n=1 Tax=Metabacillus fastidiosus TaxID=1458 RepID=UPI000AC6E903|nr:hypothetical protein [Metabacillus fastidiosus]MED4454763.1 hypothetical protein [Metabacillus fastidiosus]MED4461948.1 hypothetical protein [Metabacillus fastidiosus]